MKTIAKIIIIIAIFFVGFFAGRHYAIAPADSVNKAASSAPAVINKDLTARKIQVNLKIDFGDNNIKEFKDIAVEENETVFNVLKKVAAENNIELKYKDYGGDMGAMIESIGGVANDSKANKYWQFWVNGEFSKTGASGSKLKDRDSAEWKFAKSEF